MIPVHWGHKPHRGLQRKANFAIGKVMPELKKNPGTSRGCKPFLLSHIKAPLREEKRGERKVLGR
jgi:hypothetical protein